METITTDNLILLEFLVEDICLDCNMLQKLKHLQGENYVSFQFLDNLPLDIGEQDITPQQSLGQDDTAATRIGKSCLFSLTTEQIEEALVNFDVAISLYRKLKPGTLPDKITIGEVVISIPYLLREIYETLQKSNGVGPVSTMLKRTYTVSDYNGVPVADIQVMIRMSCFGKLIVSQFQMNLQDKSLELKGTDNQYTIKTSEKVCDKSDTPQSQFEHSKDCCCAGGQFPCPNAPFYPPEPCPPYPPSAPSAPCPAPCPPVCLKCGEHYVYGPPDPICPCLNPEPCEPLEGEYQTIDAEMGGNKFQVRVHKIKKKQGDDDCKCVPIDDDSSSCNCSQIVSISGTTAGRGEKSYKPDGTLPSGQGGCPYTIKLDATKPCACTTDFNKLQPESGDLNSPINVTICGEPQDKKIWVFPPQNKQKSEAPPIDLADPCREFYILKIAKKSEKGNLKNNLELELCAPKPRECKPKLSRRNHLIQCNESDFPKTVVTKSEGGEKKGKGKKGKGAKGGKKKGKK